MHGVEEEKRERMSRIKGVQADKNMSLPGFCIFTFTPLDPYNSTILREERRGGEGRQKKLSFKKVS
jgi:hypothetical protein